MEPGFQNDYLAAPLQRFWLSQARCARLVVALIALFGIVRLHADTNAPAATAAVATNRVAAATERDYQKLLAADDDAQTEVDQWIRDNQQLAARGGGGPPDELKQRITDRFAPVRKAYDDFLAAHPDHARARLAYGSFLNDIQDEDGAVSHWEHARELDPQNPAAWNNLANHYAHRGPVEKSFAYYTKAIELNPKESLYYHSLGTCIFLFRSRAEKYYNLTEQQVFDKALQLYQQARELDPTDFPLATDIAQTYYGIQPMRTDAAIQAWEAALKLTDDEIERQGVFIHLARINLNAGRFAEARRQLDAVKHPKYAALKEKLLRNLEEKQRAAASTNAVPEKPKL